jgi:hypothetical protein
VQLSPGAFDAFLGAIGQDFTWSKAYACPCVNPASGAANPKCQICFGRGRYWPASVPAVAGVASQKVQQAWQQFGLYQTGDTVLSVPENSPLYEAGQFDRILALNATEQFSVNLLAGTNDRLLIPVVSVTRVFWLNPTLTATIEGALPTITAGALTWPAGGGPPDDTTYSVSGTQTQEFFVFQDYPTNRGEFHGLRLPKRVVLRRFDLFGR